MSAVAVAIRGNMGTARPVAPQRKYPRRPTATRASLHGEQGTRRFRKRQHARLHQRWGRGRAFDATATRYTRVWSALGGVQRHGRHAQLVEVVATRSSISASGVTTIARFLRSSAGT